MSAELATDKRPRQSPSCRSSTGVVDGAVLMLIGSTSGEIDAVRNSRDLPGLAGFDHELRTLAARRQVHSSPVKLPTGPHIFHSFESWQRQDLTPSPAEALKLLHRLAADTGIAGIMRKHGWSVGKLSEMPPEGKVGVSPVCILGVNINAGQEISLRLRTDDLKGFRRYLSIRQTLCHELAHMVFSEHDLAFKRLNSQLCKECEAMSRAAGMQLSQAAEGWQLDLPADLSDVMAATAASSGKTLRELAGTAALPTQRPTEAQVLGVEAAGHRDTGTEAKERAAEQLGALDPEEQRPPPQASSAARPEESTPGVASPAGSASGGRRAKRGTAEVPAAPTARDNAEDRLPGGDASAEYYRAASAAAQRLASGLQYPDAAAALETLNKILRVRSRSLPRRTPEHGRQQVLTGVVAMQNALQQPGEDKFRRVRHQNPAFHARAGRFPGALELLRAAGFVTEREGQEDVLRLRRDDPGLLWISLSACEDALRALTAGADPGNSRTLIAADSS